eukprot:g23887.t1
MITPATSNLPTAIANRLVHLYLFPPEAETIRGQAGVGLTWPSVDHSWASIGTIERLGTTERVCLIQGTVEALNAVHDFIAEKVREMPQNVGKTEPVNILQPQTNVNPDRVKQ